MEWFALIIPIISCLIAIKWFRQYFTWWEYLIPAAMSVMVILLCKVCVKTSLVSDTEYWGSMVVKARYYEYWESWVEATCTRQVPCGTDSKGNTQYCTETYDCSYCDHNREHWVAYDDAGNDWEIGQEYYNYLIKKWSTTPSFIELSRSIHKSGGCGKDGDAYEISWRGEIISSEPAVTTHHYVNRVQASHSSFKLPYISKKEGKQRGLYDYPKMYDYYRQKAILGLDSIASRNEVLLADQYFEYFNGHYGPINKVKVFVLLFYNKTQNISYKQEAYWDGGNQNEFVICIGMDKKSRKMDWVRAFSWTEHKKVAIDCRDDIMAIDTFQIAPVYRVIENAVSSNIIYKDFKKDFSYLRVDLPNWSLWLIWVLTLLSVGGSWWWCLRNEYESIS